MEFRTDRMEIQTDENTIRTDTNQIRTDRMEIQTDENTIRTDTNQIRTDRMKIQTDENKIWTDTNQIRTDGKDIRTDEKAKKTRFLFNGFLKANNTQQGDDGHFKHIKHIQHIKHIKHIQRIKHIQHIKHIQRIKHIQQSQSWTAPMILIKNFWHLMKKQVTDHPTIRPFDHPTDRHTLIKKWVDPFLKRDGMSELPKAVKVNVRVWRKLGTRMKFNGRKKEPMK